MLLNNQKHFFGKKKVVNCQNKGQTPSERWLITNKLFTKVKLVVSSINASGDVRAVRVGIQSYINETDYRVVEVTQNFEFTNGED